MSIDPSASGSMSMGGGGAVPSGASPSGGGGGGGDGTAGMSSGMTDSYNFLRGGWQTNDAGIVTFNTIFPGFCKSNVWIVQ